LACGDWIKCFKLVHYFNLSMKKLALITLTILAIAACQSPKEKALVEIKTLEANDSIFSPETIEKQKSAYIDFANKYPDDDLSPEFLFKAGQRCNASAQHEEAIKLFQQVIDKYPKHKIAEEALFLQGYIYENSMKDMNRAKTIYTKFIAQYPNSELAEDAKYAIENLGKTPEQIFEEMDKKDEKPPVGGM
jgi:outer membrane protein assembly factor BamD (BamD/ComL family)